MNWQWHDKVVKYTDTTDWNVIDNIMNASSIRLLSTRPILYRLVDVYLIFLCVKMIYLLV